MMKIGALTLASSASALHFMDLVREDSVVDGVSIPRMCVTVQPLVRDEQGLVHLAKSETEFESFEVDLSVYQYTDETSSDNYQTLTIEGKTVTACIEAHKAAAEHDLTAEFTASAFIASDNFGEGDVEISEVIRIGSHVSSTTPEPTEDDSEPYIDPDAEDQDEDEEEEIPTVDEDEEPVDEDGREPGQDEDEEDDVTPVPSEETSEEEEEISPEDAERAEDEAVDVEGDSEEDEDYVPEGDEDEEDEEEGDGPMPGESEADDDDEEEDAGPIPEKEEDKEAVGKFFDISLKMTYAFAAAVGVLVVANMKQNSSEERKQRI